MRKAKVVYSDLTVAKESATNILAETQRQTEEWACFRVAKGQGFRCALGGGWGKWDSNTSPTGVLIDSPGLERKKKNRKAFVSCCQAVAWLKSICGVTGLFYS